jgi:hydrogenase maturation protease
MNKRKNILVLGIGQSMRGDDAAGLETVRLWQETHPDSAAKVQVELSEIPGLTLLEFLEGKEVAILVDALHSSQVCGTVMRIAQDELASFTHGNGSMHGWGIAETLRLCQRLIPAEERCRIILIGINGQEFGMGNRISPELRIAINCAAELLEKEIQHYLNS